MEDLFNTKQQIAEEKRRRLQNSGFLELGGRWTIDDLQLHLENGNEGTSNQELELILNYLAGVGLRKFKLKCHFFATILGEWGVR